jgi:tetratricopeptide (TPR) repeat protein
MRNISLAYYYSSDFKQSVKSYLDLEKIDTLSVDEYHKMARSYIGIKDTMKALDYYKKVLDLDPKFNPGYDLFATIASIYNKKKMFKEAGEFWIKKAVSDTTEERWKFFMYAGQFLNLGKEYDAAVVSFKQALELNANESKLHYYLGTVYGSYNKNDSTKLSIEEFKQFITLTNSNDKEKEYRRELEDAYSRLAFFEFTTKKDYTRSLELYQKLSKYDEKNAYNYLMMAYCYAQINQKEEACKSLDKCLKINPRQKDAQELKKKLSCWAYE